MTERRITSQAVAFLCAWVTTAALLSATSSADVDVELASPSSSQPRKRSLRLQGLIWEEENSEDNEEYDWVDDNVDSGDIPNIPQQLLFVYPAINLSENAEKDAYNQMISANVEKTIRAYRSAWGKPDAPVISYNEETCLELLEDEAPKEVVDAYVNMDTSTLLGQQTKADLCRVLVLQKHGGYMFDVEAEIIDEQVIVKPEEYKASFVAVEVDEQQQSFLTKMLFASPRHAIVNLAFDRLVELYSNRDYTEKLSQVNDDDDDETKNTQRPLSTALASCYNEFISYEPTGEGQVLLLQRVQLDHRPLAPYGGEERIYPSVARQEANGNCNFVLHNRRRVIPYAFEQMVGTGGCVRGLIPKRIWFSFKTNILENREPVEMYNNVMNTIKEYRTLWNDPNAPVTFLDDAGCRDMIDRAAPKLVKYFDKEKIGAYKGDICRNAAMLLYGGYYFDIDMFVVEKVRPRDSTTFVSTMACGGACFFQAFYASMPYHPIVEGSLKRMQKIYDRNGDTTMLGPISMANQYFQMTHTVNLTKFEFFEELRLDNDGPPYEVYPTVPRQIGTGNCNYVVHDPEKETIYFFARFLGYGGCQPLKDDEGQHESAPSGQDETDARQGELEKTRNSDLSDDGRPVVNVWDVERENV